MNLETMELEKFGIDKQADLIYEQVCNAISDSIYEDAIKLEFEAVEEKLLLINDDQTIINYLKTKCDIFTDLYDSLDKTDYVDFCNELVYCWMLGICVRMK